MEITVAVAWVAAVLLLSVRLVPVFAFAPPFSLLNVPVRIRVLFSLALAVCLVQVPGAQAAGFAPSMGNLLPLVMSELFIGIGIAFALQAAFGALYFAGRVLDFQAGFGLALIIDPATRAQSPLLGTLFVMTGAAVFFAVDAHHELLRVIAASLQVIPIGALASGWQPEAVVAHFGMIFVLGLATAAAVMVVLFLTDITLGFLTRTMPQMNVLVLGFQVKTLVLLLMLIAVSGLMLPAFLRIIETGLRFIGSLER